MKSKEDAASFVMRYLILIFIQSGFKIIKNNTDGGTEFLRVLVNLEDDGVMI